MQQQVSNGLEFVHTVWETDPEGRNYYQSPSWYRYVGEGPGSSYETGWLKFYHPEDRDSLMWEWTQSLRDPARPYDIQVRIRRWDGVYRKFRVAGTPLPSSTRIASWSGYCRTLDHSYPDQKTPCDEYETQAAVKKALATAGSVYHLAAGIGVSMTDLKRWAAGEAVISRDDYLSLISVAAVIANRNARQ